jgi:hypothetical protein
MDQGGRNRQRYGPREAETGRDMDLSIGEKTIIDPHLGTHD